MISANYFWNACVKNIKKHNFFFFLGEFFSSWKKDGCLVKLVAAKVIRQHMLFFK